MAMNIDEYNQNEQIDFCDNLNKKLMKINNNLNELDSLNMQRFSMQQQIRSDIGDITKQVWSTQNRLASNQNMQFQQMIMSKSDENMDVKLREMERKYNELEEKCKKLEAAARSEKESKINNNEITQIDDDDETDELMEQSEQMHFKNQFDREYKMNITNNSGDDFSVGIFQQNANQINGSHSLIWMSKACGNEDEIEFSWPLNYQFCLSWGNKQLIEGSVVKPNSQLIEVKPGNDRRNALYVDTTQVDTFKGTVIGDKNIEKNQLLIKTDNWSKELEKKNPTLILCCNEMPILAVPAKPAFDHVFNLNPTYYLSLVDAKERSVLTARARHEATKVVFDEDDKEISFEINENKTIEQK